MTVLAESNQHGECTASPSRSPWPELSSRVSDQVLVRAKCERSARARLGFILWKPVEMPILYNWINHSFHPQQKSSFQWAIRCSCSRGSTRGGVRIHIPFAPIAADRWLGNHGEASPRVTFWRLIHPCSFWHCQTLQLHEIYSPCHPVSCSGDHLATDPIAIQLL